MARYDDIKVELDTDSLARGYSGMTAVQAADNMNDVDSPNGRTVVKASVSGWELFQQTDSTEFAALSDADKQTWLALCGLVEVDPSNSSPAAPIVQDLFGGGSTTQTSLLAYRDEVISRGTELGFGNVKPGDIENARAL